MGAEGVSVVGKVFSKAADLWAYIVLRGRVGLRCRSSRGNSGTGCWGARGAGGRGELGSAGLGRAVLGVHGRGTQSRGTRGGAREAGEPRAFVWGVWGPVVGDGAWEGALVGRHGIAWPGDVAAESEPAAWRRGSSGGA